jgi:tetratricopeptide (TPR) repeat protein
VVSATSTTPTASTREGESGDAREDVPGAPAASPTRGADADASASNRDTDDRSQVSRPSLTPGQRRAAEKKAIHAKRHPNGHAKDVSLHLRAKAKARRGDKKGALDELRRGVARFPKNTHIGVSFARALADDFDAADALGEARALENALKHLDALEDATKEDKEDVNSAVNSKSASVMYQLRGVLEARRLELFALSEAEKDPGSGAYKKTASREEAAPSARRVRAAFEASVALDPEHWAAWHAWGIFEMRRGRANKARRLLREARRSDPRRARTLQTLAALEASFILNTPFGGTGSNAAALASARSLFAEAIALDATHAPSYTAWATMEARAGNLTRAARVFREGEEATRDAARDANRFDFFRESSGVRDGSSGSSADSPKERIDRDGDPLFSRSALLTAYGAFEAKRAPGSSKTRSHARTLFREACDACRRNPRAYAAWAAAEMAFEKHDATKRFPGRTYRYYLSVRKKQQRSLNLRLCAFWKRLWKRTRATSVSYTRARRRFGSRATRRAPSSRSRLCFARTQSSVGTLRRGTRWARRSATPGASTTPWTPSKKARSARRTTEKTTDV